MVNITNAECFNEPHIVVMIFKLQVNDVESLAHDTELLSHELYYKNLSATYYGKVMNDNAICVIIQVSCASDFETIIENDPSLKSGLFVLQVVTPFATAT